MAAKQDLFIDQGSTWNVRLELSDGDGLPVDLTGYTVRMALKRKLSDAELLSLTTENGRVAIPSPTTDGYIDFNITNGDTDLLSGSYFYDIEIVSAGGEVYRILQGRVVVNPSVTK